MILGTAKQHFDEDIQRARDIQAHASGLQGGRLKDDLLRSAWMVGVGASDAFFCDAYADLITRTLRAKERQPSGNLQDKLNNLKVPVVAVLNSSSGWRWRMAAREMIEKESVLSIQQIKDLLNIFCREHHKLLTQESVESWILHADTKQRHFGISKQAYQQTPAGGKAKLKKNALEKFGRRMQSVFQRRHDCIHNCDRPKSAVQPISADAAQKALEDVSFLVNRCTDHMRAEYTQYLTSKGFTGQTRNHVGA
ncbi:hypothetical protein [Roseovarius aestuariivivens]|uniref:hypothetical protein n=1 Tax=Roseovarius aestuariivivens TaxID=1888910 RepID=UPI001081C773|nr:hypothetical protein [Roseovarius aestuariivivens]